jgi:hypothetical protein
MKDSMAEPQVVYRYLQHARTFELELVGVRDAFDQACADMELDRAAPLEIRVAGEVRYTLGDLCELFSDWQEWRDGRASHPVHQEEHEG